MRTTLLGRVKLIVFGGLASAIRMIKLSSEMNIGILTWRKSNYLGTPAYAPYNLLSDFGIEGGGTIYENVQFL